MSNELLGKKILILGAGIWQVPHIKKAKELGLITYVTDWSTDAVGRVHADVFSPIDLKDKESTLEFALKNNVDAIYTSADIGVKTAAYVADKMNLKYHSLELALNATNKRSMRQKAESIGLNIPSYFSTDNFEEAKKKAKEFGYPIIIKPVDNFSSRGVSVLNNEEELNNAFKESLNASYEGKILIEEFMQGTESSVESLVKDGKAYIMSFCDKIKSELPYRYDLQLNYPGDFSKEQVQNIYKFIDDLVKGFEIQNGIIHVEIMVKDASVKLIEFAIRGCGSEVITHLMPSMLEFDVLKYLILDSLDVKQEIHFETKKFGVLRFIMLAPGKINKVEGKDKVKSIEGVLDFDIELSKGDEITEIKDGRSRPGYLLAVGDDKLEIDRIIDKVKNSFSVEYI
jgi:phosphoribosylamine-glycine ligase